MLKNEIHLSPLHSLLHGTILTQKDLDVLLSFSLRVLVALQTWKLWLKASIFDEAPCSATWPT